MPDPSQSYGGDLSGTQTYSNWNGSGSRPSSSSSNTSDSASSRSSGSRNFSYSDSSSSFGSGRSSNATSAPLSMGPQVPSSFGTGRGLYGGTANALSPGYSGPKGSGSLNTAAYMAGGMSPLAAGITSSANALGVAPQDLATAISYETKGTFNPTLYGPTTQYGRHRGLIQFGQPQAQQFGVDWNNPLQTQLGNDGAVVQYLKDAGVKPGMGLMNIYAAINAGSPYRVNATDAYNGGAPGTVADKVNTQMAGHKVNAEKVLGGKSNYVSVAQVPEIPSPTGTVQQPRAPSGSFASIDNYPSLQEPSGSYASIDNAVPLREPSGSYASINGAKFPAVAYGYGAVQGPQNPGTLRTYSPTLREPSGSFASIDNYPNLRAPSGSYASIDGAQVPRSASGSYASIDNLTPQEQQFANSVSGGFGMPGYGPGTVQAQQIAGMQANPKYTDGTQVASIGGQKIYDKPLTNPVPPLGPVQSAAANVLLYPGAAHDIGGLRNQPTSAQTAATMASLNQGNSFGRGNVQPAVQPQTTQVAAAKPTWQEVLAQMNKGKSPQEQLANTFRVLGNPTLMYG